MNTSSRINRVLLAASVALLFSCGGPPDVPGSVTTPTPLGMGQPCATALLTCGVNGDWMVSAPPFPIPFPYPRIYCGCPVGSFASVDGSAVPRSYRITGSDGADYWVRSYVTPEWLQSSMGLSPDAARIAFSLMVARDHGSPPNWSEIRRRVDVASVLRQLEPRVSAADVAAAMRAAGL